MDGKKEGLEQIDRRSLRQCPERWKERQQREGAIGAGINIWRKKQDYNREEAGEDKRRQREDGCVSWVMDDRPHRQQCQYLDHRSCAACVFMSV